MSSLSRSRSSSRSRTLASFGSNRNHRHSYHHPAHFPSPLATSSVPPSGESESEGNSPKMFRPLQSQSPVQNVSRRPTALQIEDSEIPVIAPVEEASRRNSATSISHSKKPPVESVQGSPAGSITAPPGFVKSALARASTMPIVTSDVPSNNMDPLSEQILSRVHPVDHTSPNTPSLAISIPHHTRLSRGHSRTTVDSTLQPDIASSQESGRSLTRSQTVTQARLRQASAAPSGSTTKEKRRSSFFNRFSLMPSGRRKEGSIGDASSVASFPLSETGDLSSHLDSTSRVLMSPIASGFVPHYKEPGRHVRIRNNGCKLDKSLGSVFLAQELTLSRDVARGVPISSNVSTTGTVTSKLSERCRPELTEHDGAIWCMEFSPDGRYLATAGQDGVIRVYSVLSTPEQRLAEEDSTPDPSGGTRLRAPVFSSTPIRAYAGHAGEVLDLTWSKNNFLLSSSMDKTVRLWHLDYGENICVFRHGDFVTSIAFHPKDDRFFLAGSLDSVLRLWSIPDKAVAFQSELKDLITAVEFSPDGKTAIAGCLSGMCLFYETEGLVLQRELHVRSSRGKNARGSKITGIKTRTEEDGDVSVLITSNDSRIRQYSLSTKSLTAKIKGHTNTSAQIHAHSSDDGRYIVSGSEDRRIYVWPTNDVPEDANKRPYEYFQAHDSIVTVAIMAPTTTKRLVGVSDDPIYDLCNPPPVTLIPRSEAEAAEKAAKELERVNKDPVARAKAEHGDGNIIVSADRTGLIRVWRQDCAVSKRRAENAANNRLSTMSTLTRSGSIMTKGSMGAVSQISPIVPVSSDVINNWRENIQRPRSGSGDSANSRGQTQNLPSRPPTADLDDGKSVGAESGKPSELEEREIGDETLVETETIERSIGEESMQSVATKDTEVTDSAESTAANCSVPPATENLLTSFMSRWRGRGLSMSSVAMAAIAASGMAPGMTSSDPETPPATEASEDSKVDMPHGTITTQGGDVPVDDLEPPRTPSIIIDTVKDSLESDRPSASTSGEESVATVSAPRSIKGLSSLRSSRRRHTMGASSLLTPTIEEETRPGTADALSDKNCAGCGTSVFNEKTIGGRKRTFCGGCGMLVA